MLPAKGARKSYLEGRITSVIAQKNVSKQTTNHDSRRRSARFAMTDLKREMTL